MGVQSAKSRFATANSKQRTLSRKNNHKQKKSNRKRAKQQERTQTKTNKKTKTTTHDNHHHHHHHHNGCRSVHKAWRRCFCVAETARSSRCQGGWLGIRAQWRRWWRACLRTSHSCISQSWRRPGSKTCVLDWNCSSCSGFFVFVFVVDRTTNLSEKKLLLSRRVSQEFRGLSTVGWQFDSQTRCRNNLLCAYILFSFKPFLSFSLV